MHAEILISVDPRETRVAVLENQKLVEIWIDRAGHGHLMGDIYLGIVQTVLPGMQAAFVDLGLDRAGFLHESDVAGRSEAADGIRARRPIGSLLKEGQRIVVQVVKDPVGSKGPRLTTEVSLPGRYSVLIPGGPAVGVSRRIRDEDERERLHDIGLQVVPPGMGLIIRTMAQGADASRLTEDIVALQTQWSALTRRAASAPAPSLLHREEGAAMSAVRDTFGMGVDRLIVDDRPLYRSIVRQVEGVPGDLKDRVELFEHDVPLFEYLGIEAELDRLFHRVVHLPKGGSLVIEQTEALVAIDVNTGRYTGGQDQEETVFQTNLEAAEEIARQLRLRDLGGIIVVDFIDMEDQAHRDALTDLLRNALERDRAHTRVLPVSELGIVEMTRERVRPSLAEIMTEPCLACGGSGRSLSLLSASLRLERSLRNMIPTQDAGRVRLEVNPELDAYLSENWGARWERIKESADVLRVADGAMGFEGVRFRILPPS
ncbi:MAG: Rne/Rng family ribonuclease [Candidatus Eisenbacteria bacterium]|jgi:ribonuclease G|nr:Rne/Rng family ribonuclease [Candidatus Eisenbacteria bacterium]